MSIVVDNNNYKKMAIVVEEKKSKILTLIVKSPGIRYRQLLKYTGLSNGSLSYILRKLENSKQIVVNRRDNKRITNYFPKGIRMRELHVVANLTNNIDRKIVQFLLKQEKCTFRDIVAPTNKAPSTVSWHLSRLRNANIIVSVRYNNGHSIYKLKNKRLVSEIFS